MAFLDNSGDIILDAVLTDTGRMRMAAGDGSFKIAKFAVGDDEINYGIYNKTHPSGSSYYDLEVLQTPLLEAFTNNTSNLNSRLMSISRTNILYMPVLKLNKVESALTPAFQSNSSLLYRRTETSGVSFNWAGTKFVVAVDLDTKRFLEEDVNSSALRQPTSLAGVIHGFVPNNNEAKGACVRIDQGLDTTAISPATGLAIDLQENAYIIEMDNRLGQLKSPNSNFLPVSNFIDDDNVASYYVSSGGRGGFVTNNNQKGPKSPDGTGTTTDTTNDRQIFDGPRGSIMMLRVEASTELKYSNYLFQQIGISETSNGASNIFGFVSGDSRLSNKTTYYIDSTVRVIGANTGFRMDIPIRYVKIE